MVAGPGMLCMIQSSRFLESLSETQTYRNVCRTACIACDVQLR